jgi:hypothetical protein
MVGNLRCSFRGARVRNSWILLKDPTPPMSDERAMMSDPNGSVRSVNSEREVKTVAVSSVLPPSVFFAMTEKTANARMGDTIGEI